MNNILVYTFGSASTFKRLRTGAWSYLVLDEVTGEVHTDVQRADYTTYNKMELTAIWKGLIKAISLYNPSQHGKILIHSSSKYIVNAFHKGFVYQWKANKWKGTGTSYPIKHQELWIPILELTLEFPVKFVKLEPHHHNWYSVRNDYEARVHNMAFEEMQKFSTERGFKYRPKHNEKLLCPHRKTIEKRKAKLNDNSDSDVSVRD